VNVTSAASSTTAASVASSSTPSAATPASRTFAAVFEEQVTEENRLGVARDVLANLPPPIVETLRDRPGSPAEAVDLLFGVLRDGSFKPPPGPLGAPDSMIGSTARATGVFDTPAQMWDALRELIAQPTIVQQAVEAHRLPASKAAIGEATSDWPAMSMVQATAILGGRLSDYQVEWWEQALRYLIEQGTAHLL